MAQGNEQCRHQPADDRFRNGVRAQDADALDEPAADHENQRSDRERCRNAELPVHDGLQGRLRSVAGRKTDRGLAGAAERSDSTTSDFVRRVRDASGLAGGFAVPGMPVATAVRVTAAGHGCAVVARAPRRSRPTGAERCC